MFTLIRSRKRLLAAGLIIAATTGAHSMAVSGAQDFALAFYVYAMPGVTPVACAVTPNLYDSSSWTPTVSTTVDTSPSGQALLPIGRYQAGTPVTCQIMEDSMIGGVPQLLMVTWPGNGCMADQQGNWSRIAIIAKGPGCP